MDASCRLFSVLFFFLVGSCQTESSYISLSHCQRLVPSAFTSALTPCRFPCMLKHVRAPFNIVMQSEPDGTPCKYTGHCSEGACLNMKNYAASGHFEWGTSYATRSYPNSNTKSNSPAINAAVLTSADYARSGLLSETNVIQHANQVIGETGKESGTRFFAQEPGAQNALQRLLRVKRATRRPSDDERYDSRVIESGKYESLARFRRSSKKRKRNRKAGNSRRLYNNNTYFNGNMNGAGSGRYSPPYNPQNPSVLIVHTDRKKRRKGSSFLKAVAGGVAAGGVGALTYKLFKGGKKNERASYSGAEGAESKSSEPNNTEAKANAAGSEATIAASTGEAGTGASESTGVATNGETKQTAGTESKIPGPNNIDVKANTAGSEANVAASTGEAGTGASESSGSAKNGETGKTTGTESKSSEPNKTDSKANAAGTGATVTANTGETGTGTSESASGAKNGETEKTAGTETDVTNKINGNEIDPTKNTVTVETEKTKGSGTNATVETGTAKTDNTENTATGEPKISGTGITAKTVGPGPNAIEKSQTAATEAAGVTGTDTTDKNADSRGTSSPLLTPSVRTGATGGTKLRVSINNGGVVTHITVDTGHERNRA